MRNYSRLAAPVLGTLLVFVAMFIIAAPVKAGLNIVSVLRGSSPNGSIDGLIRTDGLFLMSANFGSVSNITRNGVTFFAAGTNNNPSGTDWSTVGAFVNPSLGGYAAIDPLFFSELYGNSPVTLTVSNLNVSSVYVVQILHGEPRSCCGGNFSDNDFITSEGSMLSVPAFTLGNGVAGENPPNYLDRVIVQVELTGITSFTYRMKDGISRGPSIAGFQIRRVSPYTFFTDGTTNWIDAINLILNNPATAVLGNIGSNNRLTITNGGIVNGTYGQIAVDVGSTNNVAVITGTNSVWTNVFNLLVGLQGSFNSLLITNGGTADDNVGYVGFGPEASNNLVTVTGAGSLWKNRSHLIVGNSGPKNGLLLSNGGVVSNVTGWIGYGSGADRNSVAVNGTNSFWNCSSNLVVGNDGMLNSLLITNRGAAFSANGYIGFNSISDSNTVTVSGQNSLWNTSGELQVGVYASFNNLLIQNGGAVSNSTGWIGYRSGADKNAATVSGTNSLWNCSGNLIIGSSGQSNMLFISNGGKARNYDGYIGNNAAGVRNSVTVSGTNSSWDCSHWMLVGWVGALNSLILTNGGRATANSGILGTLVGSDGNIGVITGTNSTWNIADTLYVGYRGSSNSLLIAQGAIATDIAGTIGSDPESSGNQVTVTGSGSAWLNSYYLIVGSQGSRNTLLVTNGGTVTAENMLLGEISSSTNNLLVVDGGAFSITNNTGDGVMDVRWGTNRFAAGFITTDRLVVTNMSGRIMFNGGTFTTRSASIANGAQFVAGNGTSPASYRMSGTVGSIHSFANGLRISANATLAGNGTIGGTLTVASGGTLSPGLSIGQVILSNSPALQGATIMEIGKNENMVTNDHIQVLGTLTYGGALTVSNLGPATLAAGDNFQLFNASSYSGSFSPLTLPALPAGLTWTNRLLLSGSIAVVGVTPPQIKTVALSGTNLVFSVTNGTPNGSWALLMTTNVALPVTSWTTNRTGTFNSLGIANLTNGIIQGESNCFFLIRMP